MKWSTLLPLAVSTISLLPSVGAWEVTWHDSDNKSHTRKGHGPSECIKIDNPEGKVFKIDSRGELGINMLLFDNSDCSGHPAGSATDSFSKDSSRDLLGFKVVSLSSSTSSESDTTEKSTGHAATTSSSSSASSAKDNSSSSSIESGESTTAQAAATSSATATSESQSPTPSKASPTTSSSLASATTSNAAVRLDGSTTDFSKAVIGGGLGLVLAQIIV
ncbi:hypothetical protein VI817_004430 [Penicillium citrinum]|uniref:Uncharacterized protein n=1 Tax=Penicillium hetheringtonii TaxID=911720 RepID=A0AAD6DWF7_9EURO|nr:hypothetical protein N7450_002738 [Penicillium hetheringtonii]KAK5798139.1 hypothetical protein VI817_004430 [Penicillium citrinum]